MKSALLLGMLALGGIAQAQTPPSTTTPVLVAPISSEDQKAVDEAKRLIDTVQLWNEPVDWKETGASTAEIAAHIRKLLGAKAPLIEVRSKDTNRSTFTLEKAPLGPMMWALADLSNAGMWVFPGKLVLAPESALTPKERSAIKEGLGGEWQGDLEVKGARWNPYTRLEQISLPLVGAEIKARLAAKGGTTSVSVPPAKPVVASLRPATPQIIAPQTTAPAMIRTLGPRPLAFQLPYGELSPTAQKILQVLYDSRYPIMGARMGFPKTLPATTVVKFDDLRPNQMELRLEDAQTGDKSWPPPLGSWFVNKPQPATALGTGQN